ncbi:MAG TPA: P-loop NTPase [Clostridiaceae bacterium]|nr:P-loop NTPase [Clostridiaceae bacterium]
MFHRRINIFTGNFGSGKTEIAVNFAMKLKEKKEKVAIVDFDIVNPYFRTMDVKKELEKKGIRVIASMYANTNVDVPAVSPEVNTLFEDESYTAVFDVGGDDLGAKIVSAFKEEFMKEDYAHFFVVNVKRPMTNTAEKIKEMIASIEESAGIKVTHLINNTNLMEQTSLEDILEGDSIIREISKELNIEVAFTSGFKEIIRKASGKVSGEMFYITKMIKLPWEKDFCV